MTAQEIIALYKDIKPGVWKIGVTYKKDITVLKGRGKAPSPAAQAGIAQGDIYKIVFRWCSARVKMENTKAFQNARQKAIDDAAAKGKTFTPHSSGFSNPTNDEELDMIQYSDRTGEPCLILKRGPHPDKIKYYLHGNEITAQDIQDMINKGILSKTTFDTVEPNAVFHLYPDKVMSIKMDGIETKTESLNPDGKKHVNEATITFKGIAVPNEDGFYGDEMMSEEFFHGIAVPNEDGLYRMEEDIDIDTLSDEELRDLYHDYCSKLPKDERVKLRSMRNVDPDKFRELMKKLPLNRPNNALSNARSHAPINARSNVHIQEEEKTNYTYTVNGVREIWYEAEITSDVELDENELQNRFIEAIDNGDAYEKDHEDKDITIDGFDYDFEDFEDDESNFDDEYTGLMGNDDIDDYIK